LCDFSHALAHFSRSIRSHESKFQLAQISFHFLINRRGCILLLEPIFHSFCDFINASIKLQVGTSTNSSMYKLPANGNPVVVANRKIGSINTVSGNLIQCQPVSSTDDFQPGQFPISVSDGAASTKWQPEFANNVSSLTVTFPESASGKLVKGFYFDWAQNPPQTATVVFHNNSVANATSAFATRSAPGTLRTRINVTISDPWNPKANSDATIMLQGSNTTNYTFPSPVPASKFATLIVSGNMGLDKTDREFKNGTGATVAEWAILEAK